MKKNHAFTLIELLLVIAVIVLIAALLLSSLAKAKQKTQTIQCLNHLKQWGLATQLFANDNEDLLPREGVPTPIPANMTKASWYNDLPPVIGQLPYHLTSFRTNTAGNERSLFLCPQNTRGSNGTNLFHYCLNQNINGTGEDATNQVKISSVPQPVLTVWLFDSKNRPAVGSANFVHTNLHNNGANFTFLDGHAARFKNTAYWDFTTQKAITNNPNLIWVP